MWTKTSGLDSYCVLRLGNSWIKLPPPPSVWIQMIQTVYHVLRLGNCWIQIPPPPLWVWIQSSSHIPAVLNAAGLWRPWSLVCTKVCWEREIPKRGHKFLFVPCQSSASWKPKILCVCLRSVRLVVVLWSSEKRSLRPICSGQFGKRQVEWLSLSRWPWWHLSVCFHGHSWNNAQTKWFYLLAEWKPEPETETKEFISGRHRPDGGLAQSTCADQSTLGQFERSPPSIDKKTLPDAETHL